MGERLAAAALAVAVLAMTWNACARHAPAWSAPDTSLARVTFAPHPRVEPTTRALCPADARWVLEDR